MDVVISPRYWNNGAFAGTPKMIMNEWMGTSKSDHHQLDQILNYHFSTGGKQLRAQLVFSQAKKWEVDKEQARIWAGVCEFLHNATLIHDDIQDNDPIRRGQQSLWKKYGLAQAINAGDLLIFKAFTLASSLNNPRLISHLAELSEKLVQGQSMELSPLNPKIVDTWSNYLKMAELKTGALFLLPATGVNLLSGRKLENDWEKPWLNLGICFQVVDDLKDYFGLKQSNQKHKDLTEKKLNAITSLLFNKNNEKVLRSLYTNDSENSRELVDQVIAAVQEYKITNRLIDWVKQELSSIKAQEDLQSAELLFSHIDKTLIQMESLNV